MGELLLFTAYGVFKGSQSSLYKASSIVAHYFIYSIMIILWENYFYIQIMVSYEAFIKWAKNCLYSVPFTRLSNVAIVPTVIVHCFCITIIY